MRFFTHFLSLFTLLCLLQNSQPVGAQTLGILGNGTSTNVSSSEPAPFQDYLKNSRKQYLFSAAELSSIGMATGSTLTKIGWEITTLNGAGLMEGYTINYKWTTLNSLTATFQTGTTNVYGPTNFTPSAVGNVDFTLTSATTAWNGTDNLLIEICEGSIAGGYTFNCSTPYTSVIGSSVFFISDLTAACSNTTGITSSSRPNTRVNFTGGVSCFSPVALVASNITTSSADLSWTAPVPAPGLGYTYFYNTSGTPPGVSGTFVSGTSVSLSSLTSNTTYYFWIRSVCAVGDTSIWKALPSFKTICAPVSVPFTEGFESGSIDQTDLTGCWSQQSITGTQKWTANNTQTSYNRLPRTGSWNAYLFYGNEDWLFYPVALTGSTAYTFEVYARQDGNNTTNANITLAYGVSPSAVAMTNNIAPATGLTNGSYQSIKGNFTPASGGTYYVGIKGFINSSPWYISVDDISLILAPSCLPPTSLVISNITTSSATISWTAPTAPPAGGYDYYYSTSNTPPTGMTIPSGSTGAGVTTANLAGLSAYTSYYFWVRSKCGSMDLSSWAGPAQFHTGYCLPSSSTNSTYINNFSTTGGTTNISNLASGYTVGGYQDNFASPPVTQIPGSTFNFTAAIVGGTVGAAIWIDWNNNLVFDSGERVFNTSGYGSGPFTGSITVPMGTVPGNYRMRMLIDFNNSNPSDPCASNSRLEAEDYKVTVVSQPTDAMYFVELTSPANATIYVGSSVDVFSKGIEPGVTDMPGLGAGIVVWIGTSSTNTDPYTWTTWNSATFDSDYGTYDLFKAAIGSTLVPGTYYYASRWQLNGGPYRYGGYNAGGGGFWDGITNVSGVLTVNPPANDDCTGAIAFPAIPTDGTCVTLSNQSTAGATNSNVTPTGSCSSNSGTPNDDIWFSFVAPSTSLILSYTYVSGETDIYTQVFSSGCGPTMTSILCTDTDSGGTITGLTIGNTYYIRMYTYYTSGPTTQNICLKTPPPMMYLSSTTTQASTSNVTAGNINQQILQVAVVVSGSLNPLSVTQLNLNTVGSTNPPTDISAAKIFYTGTSSTFNTTTQFGSTVSNPNGNYSVTGSQALIGGTSNTTNYFWIAYDLPCNATVSNVIDGECTGVLIGTLQTPTVTAPAGSRTIIAATNTATTNQPSTATVTAGKINNQVLRLQLTSCANSLVTSIVFSTIGSTSPLTDITTARVFYTTTATFDNSIQFGSDVGAPNGVFTVTGSQILASGNGYFWLVYDVPLTATDGNLLDAAATSSIINGSTVTPGTTNPNGSRKILTPPVNDEASGALVIAVASGCTTGDLYKSTKNVIEPANCFTTSNYTVWYKFAAPASGAVKITTDLGATGGLTDSRLALFASTIPSDYSTFNIIGCDDDNGTTTSLRSTIYATGLTPGTDYFIQVDQYNPSAPSNSNGIFCLQVEELSSSMISTNATCATAVQTPSSVGAAINYKGWSSFVDDAGKLVMLVRNPTGIDQSTYSNVKSYVNTNSVRQDGASKYYLDRNFAITNSNSSGIYDLQLFFLTSERAALGSVDPSAATLANLNVTRDPGVNCKNAPTGTDNTLLVQSSSGTVGGVDWVQVSTSGFSGFFINTGFTPLPVNLLSFDAKSLNNKTVQLTWNVASEVDVKEYVVERSNDNRNWSAIGSVKASQKSTYGFNDNSPVNGVNYYRLAVKDVNASVAYSDIRTVNFSGKGNMALYPNPANNTLYVSGTDDKNVVVSIYNEVGQIVNTLSSNGETIRTGGIDVSQLLPGAYSIQVKGESGLTTMRFVKQ